jgi:hypothetical protein
MGLKKMAPFLSAADEVVVQSQTKNFCLILDNHLVCANLTT